MTAALSTQWWKALAEELSSDARWLKNARWIEARFEFDFGDGIATLDVDNGRIVAVGDGAHPHGSTVYFTAPRDEWEAIASGEKDFYLAQSPEPIGRLRYTGDALLVLRNLVSMLVLTQAMARITRGEAQRPAPSPGPRPSGKETVGRYIMVDGVRTYYEEAGDGDKVIVCFHAASQDTLMYRHVLDGLSDEYRVIAVDAPGHAKSLPHPGGHFTSITQHAEFNEKFMEALGLVRPAIIGCSFAGNQVLELAARRPGAYAAIVSSEGADYTPTVSQMFLDVIEVDGHQVVEGWAESLTGDRTPQDRADEVLWQIRRNPPEVMCADLTGYGNFDQRDIMGNITDPVLLLRGDADWLVSQAQVEATRSRVPGSEIAVLAGTGHYPMSENPYEYNETVRTFLKKVGF